MSSPIIPNLITFSSAFKPKDKAQKAKADNINLFIIVMNFRYSNISKNSLFPSISKRDIAH